MSELNVSLKLSPIDPEDFDPVRINWDYQFCVSIMVSAVTGAKRTDALFGGASSAIDGNAFLEAMVSFAAAGMLALVTAPSTDAET